MNNYIWAGRKFIVRHLTRKAALKSRELPLIVETPIRSNYVCHDSTLVNLVDGIMRRVKYRQVGGEWISTETPLGTYNLSGFQGYMDSIAKIVGRCFPLTSVQFLNGYEGMQRKAYERAFSSLVIKPLNKRDSTVKAFIKLENSKVGKCPRIISPRDPRYHVSLGLYIRSCEHQIYLAIDKMFGHKVVMKNLNAIQRAKVIEGYMQPGWVAIGLDASRFDASVSQDWLELEHSVYKKIFRYDQTLCALLRAQLYYKCLGVAKDGLLTYDMCGTRSSGDMNTSLGNILIMTCILFNFTRYIDCRVINDGDDAIIFCKLADIRRVELLRNFIAPFGFYIEMEHPVSILERVEFCQAKPVWNGQRYIMTRNTPTCIQKDMLSNKLRSALEMRDWLASVSECGVSLTSGIPILQSWYMMLGKSKGEANRKKLRRTTGMYYLAKGIESKHRCVTERARYSFWLAFGITPDMQLCIENLFDNHSISISLGECTTYDMVRCAPTLSI